MTAVSRVALPAAGHEFSRIICGTWRWKNSSMGFDLVGIQRLIETCLSVGITSFDLADIYGGYGCEAAFGVALRRQKSLRARIQIVTKCGILTPAAPHARVETSHYNASAEYIRACVDRSLRNLGIEHLDLLLIHRPDWLASADDTAAGLSTVIQQGKVLAVGVSNYTPSQISLLQSRLSFPLAANQIELSPFHMDPLSDGTLDYCEENGIKPMAWSPLGGGQLFSTTDPVAARLAQLAQKLAPKYQGASLEQMILAWILALPSRPLVVLGTSRPERILSAVKAEAIELIREDWYDIWTEAAGHGIL